MYLILQNVPTINGSSVEGTLKGAYTVFEPEGTPDVILVGTGSELSLCFEAKELLNDKKASPILFFQELIIRIHVLWNLNANVFPTSLSLCVCVVFSHRSASCLCPAGSCLTSQISNTRSPSSPPAYLPSLLR